MGIWDAYMERNASGPEHAKFWKARWKVLLATFNELLRHSRREHE
jgi:hypothetical protein